MGVASRNLGACQACDGVQLKIATNFIRACLLEFLLIRIINCYHVIMPILEHSRALSYPF